MGFLMLVKLEALFPVDYAGLIMLVLFWAGVIVLMLPFRSWRRRYTFPRLGYAELAFSRIKNPYLTSRQRWASMMPFFLAMFLFTLLLGYMIPDRATDDRFIRLTGDGFFRVTIAMGLAASVTMLRGRYSWPFAVMLIGLGILARWQHVNVGWVLGAMGLLLMVFGLLKFRCFLRDYPVMEADDGEE
jgi:hypothetical protein